MGLREQVVVVMSIFYINFFVGIVVDTYNDISGTEDLEGMSDTLVEWHFTLKEVNKQTPVPVVRGRIHCGLARNAVHHLMSFKRELRRKHPLLAGCPRTSRLSCQPICTLSGSICGDVGVRVVHRPHQEKLPGSKNCVRLWRANNLR